VPPPVFDAFAVNVTLVPIQIVVLGLAVKFTEGVADAELTVIFTAFEVAVVVVKQDVPPLIVIVQVTLLPLAKVLLVNVLDVLFWTLVLPTLKL
jgi:hypothetical protein